ncbi:MAG: FtsL-like putative cell division protein [Bacteroidales bacterium]|nr:FtsL-like putative cell division protein [Bacteroidales bacterium]
METKEKTEAFLHKAGNIIDSNKSPLSKEFYSKHMGKAFLIMFMLYGYIQLRYAYDMAIYDLGKLKEELADARYVTISTWGELTSKNKPEKVRGDLSSKADLITADEPPYRLK